MENQSAKTSIVKLLGGIQSFSGLNVLALNELYSLFKERRFKKEQSILEEGSEGNSMMVILSGEARVTQMTGTASEEALVVLKAGEEFGEMALLENLPRSATVIAQTDVIVLEIAREDFMGFIRKNPLSGITILLNIAKTLSSRLRETDNKLKAFVNFSQWV